MNFSFFKYIKSLFKHLLLFILFHNKNLYPKIESTNYGGHKIGEDFSQASKNPIHLILLNIFFPGRIYQRIRYGWFPILLDSKSKKSTNLILFPESNEKEESLIKRTADTIKVHGAAVVDGYFSNQKIDEIKSQYRECMPSDNTKNMDGIATGKILPLDISNFWLDEFILNVTCNYMGRFPYASTYPFIASYKPTKHKKTKKFADFWHMDLGCYFTATIFLDDILQNGSRMEIVSGTNRIPFYPSNLTDKYIKEKSLKILPCYGSKGSIQFHCGNVFHRFHPIHNSSRTWLQFFFTSGPHIIFDPKALSQMLKGKFTLEDLNDKQREILSGLFPEHRPRGYQKIKGGIIPNRFMKQQS